jgi:hypothetical protein
MTWDFGGGTTPPPAPDWGDTTGISQPTGGGFDGPGHLVPTGGGGTVSAPTVWLLAGLVAALAAIGIELATSSWQLSAVGWFVGGPLAIALLGVFIARDTTRRADPWYADAPWTGWVRRLLVVVSLVAVALGAYTIADVASRGGIW